MKYAKKSNPRRILHILMVLCAAGVLYSAFILISDNREYAGGDAAYQQVRQIRESSEPAANQTNAPPQIAGEVSIGEKTNGQNDSVDFSSLEEINPDVVAWLTCEGTEIDYPVVLGTDNDYYLRHLFTGERNKLGAIFIDYRNHGDFSDKNTIIYGHNMKDGSMFSSLTKYKNQNYYDSYPAMVLYTPDGDYKIELFAGIIVDGNYESIRFDFKNDHDFQSYIDSLKKMSTFESNTIVEADDQIVTLCTCSYEFNNARYALYGKLTPVWQSGKDEVP